MNRKLLIWSVGVTIALAVVAGVGAMGVATAATVASTVVATLTLYGLVATLWPAPELPRSALDTALPEKAEPARRPPDYVGVEHAVVGALESAALFETRFIPSFRAIVAQRLLARRGVNLVGSPRARELLSHELWELVAVDRSAKPRRGGGISPEQLRVLIEEVEQL
jgi:hypothetical protein